MSYDPLITAEMRTTHLYLSFVKDRLEEFPKLISEIQEMGLELLKKYDTILRNL